MKKLLFVLFLFIFASSASATIYRWTDKEGVVNFTDDESKVPPNYRNKAEEIKVSKIKPPAPSQAPTGKTTASAISEETARQAPPIAQTLIREGEFAIKLAESLKVGRAQNEAEAENMLTSVGISPKNGWIADYPLTPDIIGELQNSIGSAADSGKLGIKRNEAITAFQGLAAGQDLPVRTGTEGQDAGAEPPGDYGEYLRPEGISNYYNNEGPPVVTYYPPPWDYYYLYAWVPYPFWCSRFWFPGFFVLRDFHRGFTRHGHARAISNHFRDPGTGRIGRIDPATRRMGNAVADRSHPRREFTSREASHSASSILNHSYGHTRLNTAMNRGSGARYPRSGMVTRYSPNGGVSVSRLNHGSSSGHPGSSSGHGRGMERSSGPPSSGRSGGFQSGGVESGGASKAGGGGRR